MLGSAYIIISLMKAMILLFGLLVAQAAEPTGTMTLACEGTRKEMWASDKPEPVSMGMILDFKARTFESLTFRYLRIVIKEVTETTIAFEGSNGMHTFGGVVDRVTGCPPSERNDNGRQSSDVRILTQMQANATDVLDGRM